MKKIQYLLAFMVQCLVHVQTEECQPDKDECVFYFTVNEGLTMVYDDYPVFANDSGLYQVRGNKTYKVPMDKVITMDGFKRAVITVNNTIPGPPIIVYEGQRVVVNVTNKMLTDIVSIHWHGMYQRGTPYSDGVAFITQCPTNPGQHFVYNFTASPHGTFFYHSHAGGQRVDGLFGALIVKERPTKEESAVESPKDVIMHIGDWIHPMSSVARLMKVNREFEFNPNFVHPTLNDGTLYQAFMWESGYVEGRGQYHDPVTGNWTKTPYQIYNVEANKRYRFRVIGSGLLFPLRVSVDNHFITIVASDGRDINPNVVESFIINPGERYDFILVANQTVGNYWIRAKSMVNLNHTVLAILRYANASEAKPTTSRMDCTTVTKCYVLNCPFLYFNEDYHTICIQINQLQAKYNTGDPVPIFVKGDSLEYFMNWAVLEHKPRINGNNFIFPSDSALSQPKNIPTNIKCKSPCAEDKICSCYYQLDIPFNKTIQMIWTNHGVGGIHGHPIHLHAHSFHVMAIGFADYNITTGQYITQNKDINCGNTSKNYCNNPTWTNIAWGGDEIPNMNFENPPQKDTLMLPAGAYAVIRFRSDNPGKWFFHCHIAYHSMNGMDMVISEAAEMIPPPPPGYPTCKSFDHNPQLNEANMKPRDMSEKNIFMGLFVACIVIVLIESIVLLVLYCKGKTGRRLFGSDKYQANYQTL